MTSSGTQCQSFCRTIEWGETWTSFDAQSWHWILECWRNFKGDVPNFSVDNVSVDILAPNGVKSPAGTVLTYFRSCTGLAFEEVTHWGWDNGLSPGRRQAIIWTNVGISLIGPLGTNFSEILHEIEEENAFENVWKMAAIMPQCVKRYLQWRK